MGLTRDGGMITGRAERVGGLHPAIPPWAMGLHSLLQTSASQLPRTQPQASFHQADGHWATSCQLIPSAGATAGTIHRQLLRGQPGWTDRLDVRCGDLLTMGQRLQLLLQSDGGVVSPEHLGRQSIHPGLQVLVQAGSLGTEGTQLPIDGSP